MVERFGEVPEFFTTWNSIVCVRMNSFSCGPLSVRNRTSPMFVSLKLTPTIGGPYGIPYAVPSGGPRASWRSRACVRDRDHKDPGLLRSGTS